ncbi:MAG: NADPH-dependent 7-cyano-7-deazaguanine reductase QueF [Armatimonadetes bacterium]|nr:NADPH-dependent 7-cyano-7-deazaguanine reductase QueF [Armatimonadota bacterium]
MSTQPSKQLEIVPNPKPERDYVISIECPEFTCVCPKTGQPDFATIRVEYTPDQGIIELKSMKLYFWSYRETGTFHEAVTNQILDDFVAACQPRWMKVVGDFNVRGGIHTVVTAEYRA